MARLTSTYTQNIAKKHAKNSMNKLRGPHVGKRKTFNKFLSMNARALNRGEKLK